jgi:hypothetical protein
LVGLITPAIVGTLQSTAQEPESTPRISSARIKGKKLIVTGENFTPGAYILINGQIEKTKANAEDPTGMLIAKKGAKRIDMNEVAALHVVTPEGVPSSEFRFFPGPRITFADANKTLTIAVGEVFLVDLGDEYGWTVDYQGLTNIVAVPTLLPILGTQGLYVPTAPGKSDFRATGQPICEREQPSCAKAPFIFETTIQIVPRAD